MMTKATVKTLCNAVGISCKWVTEYREYQIGRVQFGEAGTYFTDCPYDAVGTALSLAAYIRQNRRF